MEARCVTIGSWVETKKEAELEAREHGQRPLEAFTDVTALYRERRLRKRDFDTRAELEGEGPPRARREL